MTPRTNRNLTPEELGAGIYEMLRASMSSGGDLSLERLQGALAEHEEVLDEQFAGTVMIGAMYAATLAVGRSTTTWVSERIQGGIISEFYAHLKEQGASSEQVSEWKVVLAEHWQEYARVLDGYEGYEPPWRFGRSLLWFLSSDDHHLALAVKDATMFLLKAEETAQDLMNTHGPKLEVDTLSA